MTNDTLLTRREISERLNRAEGLVMYVAHTNMPEMCSDPEVDCDLVEAELLQVCQKIRAMRRLIHHGMPLRAKPKRKKPPRKKGSVRK